MMHPEKTYELVIQPTTFGWSSLSPWKERVVAWLQGENENTFVEGSVDNIDLDPVFGEDDSRYRELENQASPIIIYKYSQSALAGLRDRIQDFFAGNIATQINELSTKNWQEGWMKSFCGFSTQAFYVHPPWEFEQSLLSGKEELIIDPGMAFGTGQHPTTKLCLDELNEVIRQWKLIDLVSFSQKSLLDLGTGSGILAIGAAKLGMSTITAADIDADALYAARSNMKLNHVNFVVTGKQLIEIEDSFDLVVANILLPFLRDNIAALLGRLASGGKLILSGITEDQVDALLTAAAEIVPILKSKTRVHEGWACLTLCS